MQSPKATFSHGDLTDRRFSDSSGLCPVLLIFSPLFESPHPYLAVPHLTAYLRKHGCQVIPRDYNGELFRLGNREDFLNFVKDLLTVRLANLGRKRQSQEIRADILSKHLALAAVASLQSTAGTPLLANTFDIFLRKMYCMLRGFGFPDHHLYNHDFADFLDDYLLFQRTDNRIRDPRFPWRTTSTIDQEISPSDIMDEERNLYLSIFERFFLHDMLAGEPRIAGISIPTNEQVIPALSLAWLIKKHCPSTHVTMGGAFVSHMGRRPAEVLAGFPFIDSLVLHEGERPLLGLVHTVEHGLPLSEVPNLLYKEGKEVHATPPCKPEDLLNIPPPEYDDFPPVLEDSYALSVYASRGCYWARCNYCNYVVLGAEGASKHHRNMAAVYLVDQINRLQARYNVSTFRLVTEAFPPSLCRDLSEEVIQRGLRVTMNTWVRAESQFTPELCRLMFRAGLIEITVGVESFCDRVLKQMDKGYTGKQAARILNNMLDAGLDIQINIIVGYPTETRQECEESLRILKTEVGLSRIPAISVFPFVLFDNIGVYQKMEEYGLTGFHRIPLNGHLFHKGIFIRYSPSRGMSLREVGEMASRYAIEFEIAHAEPTSSENPTGNIFLYPGQEVAGIKAASVLMNGSTSKRHSYKPAWLVANFARGSFHAYPLKLGNFFSWIAKNGESNITECLHIMSELCNIRPSQGRVLLQELIRNGIIQSYEETDVDRAAELSSAMSISA